MTATVGSELLNEIERVSAKRERWKGYAAESGPMGNFAPALFLMTRAINQAKKAVQSDDPAAAIAALKTLREYDDND